MPEAPPYIVLCQSTSLCPAHHLLGRIEALHGAGGAGGRIGRKTRLPASAGILQLSQVFPAARERMRTSRRVSRLARLHAYISSCPPKEAAGLCSIRNDSLRHLTRLSIDYMDDCSSNMIRDSIALVRKSQHIQAVNRNSFKVNHTLVECTAPTCFQRLLSALADGTCA